MSQQPSQNPQTSHALVASGREATAAPKVRTEVLSFHLGKEEYGIALSCVQEIRSFQAPTRLAGASAEVLGVLDLRGEMLPVIDLRRCFQMPAAAVTAATVTIVVNLNHRSVGIVVDNVNEVVELSAEQQRSMPAMNGMANDGHISGIGSVGARMLLLLDINRLLDGRDLCAATADIEMAQEVEDCLA